jgi:hypothetical protein
MVFHRQTCYVFDIFWVVTLDVEHLNNVKWLVMSHSKNAKHDVELVCPWNKKTTQWS